MSNLTSTTYITLPDGEEVRIDWIFSPYDPGRSTGPVETCYPPEGGELLSCTIHHVAPNEPHDQWLRDILGDDIYEQLEEEALVQAETEDFGDRADRLYDEWRDRELEVRREDER